MNEMRTSQDKLQDLRKATNEFKVSLELTENEFHSKIEKLK